MQFTNKLYFVNPLFSSPQFEPKGVHRMGVSKTVVKSTPFVFVFLTIMYKYLGQINLLA